jgi:two-component system OmpR family response regulator
MARDRDPEATVLVVDDDPAVLDTVADGLSVAGYRALRATNGAAAVEMVRTLRPDLVILDVSMPRMDGFAVLERLRGAGQGVPVIVLTARHDRDDRVKGLRLGADDYVTKPFGLEELLLRVRAVLRRAAGGATSSALVCGPIVVDTDAVSASVDGRPIDLSPTEFRLLAHLAANKNRVLSKEQLLEAVWGIDFDTSTTVVETFVSYLRRKLAPFDGHLRTVRGFGVKLVDRT